MIDRRFVFLVSFFFTALTVVSLPDPARGGWQRIDEGLYLGEFASVGTPAIEPFRVTILRIHPNYYCFKLFSASENGGQIRTAEEWCKKTGALAAINASMYQEDFSTSTGYMKNYFHKNNSRVNSKFGAFLAFNPIDATVPQVQIIDRYTQDWGSLLPRYHTVIQNYRMISTRQENLWPQSEEGGHSHACIAMDKQGNVLFILGQSLHSTHEFSRILLSLPVDIYNAMYVEGGPEASLYLSVKGKVVARAGTDEAGETDDPKSSSFWPLPNVIGVFRR